jgi:TonB family protein
MRSSTLITQLVVGCLAVLSSVAVAQQASPLPVLTRSGHKVYTYVEQMPQLPGVVDADGTVQQAKIAKGLSPAFDAAVVAAVKQLPRFEPGKQAGQAVAVVFTLPVDFKAKP